MNNEIKFIMCTDHGGHKTLPTIIKFFKNVACNFFMILYNENVSIGNERICKSTYK